MIPLYVVEIARQRAAHRAESRRLSPPLAWLVALAIAVVLMGAIVIAGRLP